MMPSDSFAPFLPVVQAFEKLGIAYHIGGSVASSLWGVPRSTLNADLVADITAEQVADFVSMLESSYYIDENMIQDAISHSSSFNLIHYETMFKIDIFVRKPDPFEDSIFRRARSVPIGNPPAYELRFASPEDTILHKLVWYRRGGEISERQWQDILAVLRVQRQTLDTDYLNRWADTLDLTQLLRRAIDEAGS